MSQDQSSLKLRTELGNANNTAASSLVMNGNATSKSKVKIAVSQIARLPDNFDRWPFQQREMLAAYLEANLRITAQEAACELGIVHLKRRIQELRKEGYVIFTGRRHLPYSGALVAAYGLYRPMDMDLHKQGHSISSWIAQLSQQFPQFVIEGDNVTMSDKIDIYLFFKSMQGQS